MYTVETDLGVRCHVIDDLPSLQRMIQFISGKEVIGFDTETTSKFVPNARLVGMSFAVGRKEGFYIPLGHDFGDQIELATAIATVKGVLEGPGITAANGKFDIRIMRKYGVEVSLSLDSMSITRLLGLVEYGVGLKPSIKRFYGEDVTEFSDVVPKGKKGKGMTFAQVEISEAAKYAVPDAINTWRLTVDALPKLPEDNRKFLLPLEVEVMRIAADMEDFGLPIDLDYVERQIEAGEVIMQQIYHEAVQELERLATMKGRSLPTPSGGINFNSTPQLREILFDVCGLPVIKRSPKTKQPSADASVLEKLAKKFGPVNKIAEWRSAQTSIGRFREFLEYGVERDGWWWTHASLNPTGASTGRWSGSDPNTQNLPKFKTTFKTDAGEWAFKLRDSVCAPPGMQLVSADYSQIELRMAAGLSRCRLWLDAYDQDEDIHTVTAAAALQIPRESVTSEQRQTGKTLNFSMLFGAQAENVAEQLGISVDLAQRFIDGFWQGLPEVTSWVSGTEAFCKKEGYTSTYFGRRRYLPDVWDERRFVVSKALREAVNHPIQGTAADILKIALRRQRDEMAAMGASAFLVIHDQILWAVPMEISPKEFCERIKPRVEMEIPGFPAVVVDFGIGQRYGSLVEYKGREIPERWDEVAEEEREAKVETLMLAIDREITKAEVAALSELMAAHPGDRRVVLKCKQGEFPLGAQTSLNVSDRLRWQAAVRNVWVMTYD